MPPVLVVGDHGSIESQVVVDPISGLAVDMTGGSALLKIKLNGILLSRAMTVPAGTAGVVTYPYVAGDLHSAGEMVVQVIATTAGAALLSQIPVKRLVQDPITTAS